VATIIFAALVELTDVILIPVFERLMNVPLLRPYPAEAIAIIVGVFARTVVMARVLVDPNRPSDDSVMLPTLFAAGASFAAALLVCIQMWKRDIEQGLNTAPAATVFVFAVIMSPGVSLGFWCGVRSYKRRQS